ncbi:uncharacterized protein PHACADRAFT_261271 [Phanerochaete carnosa HHB-10118-sp]|uniref:Uncharacterized protein n=1 Tax=Phanerochaete carnosa (strain HHB-10118-sp) TaxID=650164 RepID=K5W0Q3_PHACS|nr:uncharacterized protein PHACADRAFT_261271 [Phanerochaete carnosa HHB-10118-sp]EKM52680.1 hypothetical protein PHACADRAFT_261271 [Phanerochaete carnosa HHB-10118-sp]
MKSILWLSLFVLLVSEYENSELNQKGERRYDARTFQGFMEAQHALPWKLLCEPGHRLAVMMPTNYLAKQTYGLHPTVGKIICDWTLCALIWWTPSRTRTRASSQGWPNQSRWTGQLRANSSA